MNLSLNQELSVQNMGQQTQREDVGESHTIEPVDEAPVAGDRICKVLDLVGTLEA